MPVVEELATYANVSRRAWRVATTTTGTTAVRPANTGRRAVSTGGALARTVPGASKK